VFLANEATADRLEYHVENKLYDLEALFAGNFREPFRRYHYRVLVT
jgi:hypothetical protein